MPLTISIHKNGHYITFTLPGPTGEPFPPIHLKIILEDDFYIRFRSPNADGYIPYPTELRPIFQPSLVPEPLTFLAAQHNFLLGEKRLLLPPPTNFGYTNFGALVTETANRRLLLQQQQQQQPVVNA